MKRVLSGIQPSGTHLHIGNYFGAVKQFIELQDTPDRECFFFIANLHAMTTITDRKTLLENSLEVAAEYLAFGLDPEKSVVFLQSDVPEVTELAWYLSNVTPFGLLERCHSYKDKTSKGISPNHGLFAYPVLMAADILICRSNLVPVGKDQKQHLEVTRDIAARFNHIYGDVFPLPEPIILSDVAEVPGTDGRKMSKSYGNTIDIFAPEKAVKKTIMSTVTDSRGVDEPKDPDTCTPLRLLGLFMEKEAFADYRQRFADGGIGYGDVKKKLFEAFMDRFAPVRKRREDIIGDMEAVRKRLLSGAQKASDTTAGTMKAVREAVGVPV